MKVFKILMMLAVATVLLASCAKNPPSGPKGPAVLDTLDLYGGGGNNNNTQYGDIAIYLKYDPGCSEALYVELYDDSRLLYVDGKTISQFYPYDVNCDYYGVALFQNQPYGEFKVWYEDCYEGHFEYFSLNSSCQTVTPQVSEGDYVYASFFTSGSSNGLVTITINGIDIQRAIQAFTFSPDDCFSSGVGQFYLPAGRYYVRYGDAANPYRYGEWMNFYYDCNMNQLFL